MSNAFTLPTHVAFIMDGNGRWAKERGLARVFGHQAGAETVRRVVTFARKRGISYLTLYAFSTENWSRPPEEVDALMRLLSDFIAAELPTMMDNNVSLRIIGDMRGLSDALQQDLAGAVAATAANTSLVLSLAINYGGRDEIIRAVRKAAEQVQKTGDASWLDEAAFSRCLDTAGVPDPDLIIRTAGEMRLSNFLIWQGAYAELHFTERRWPEFSDEDFESALEEYSRRTRKFGGL